MTPAPAFPLAGVVAVVGSRHGSPYPVGQFAAAVVQAGGSVVTGCARGVDQVAARTAAAAAGVHPARLLPPAYLALNHLPRVLVCRAYDRSARALAQRHGRVGGFGRDNRIEAVARVQFQIGRGDQQFVGALDGDDDATGGQLQIAQTLAVKGRVGRDGQFQ